MPTMAPNRPISAAGIEDPGPQGTRGGSESGVLARKRASTGTRQDVTRGPDNSRIPGRRVRTASGQCGRRYGATVAPASGLLRAANGPE